MGKGNKHKRNGVSSLNWLRENKGSLIGTVLVAIASFFSYSSARHKELHPPVVSPSIQSVERNIPRIEWLPDKKFASFLDMKGLPVILQNSVAATFPKWTIPQIANMVQTDSLWGLYRSDTGVFGPYYDPAKPMHQLSSLHQQARYDQNASLPKDQIVDAFTKHPGRPPFYALSTSLADIHPELEDKLQLEELIAPMPSRSSVNIWLGSVGGVTPCHFDGYRNMYVQLSGVKHFVLFPPERRDEVAIYPFLHPSYGQCQMKLSESMAWRTWNDRVEVLLQPGELLYIPPYWIHEVTTIKPGVSVNAWTDIEDSSVLEQLFQLPVPGLSEPYPFLDSLSFTEQEVQQYNISIPMRTTMEPFKKLSCRMILGGLLVLEILDATAGRHRGIRLLGEATQRYASVISEGQVAALPPVLAQPLVDFLVHWSPASVMKARDMRPVYEVWFAEISFQSDIEAYISDVSALLRELNERTREVSVVTYIEFLALQVGGPARASSFMLLLDALVQVITGSKEGGIIQL